LAANPRLTAAERDVGIASGQSIQAGALINPELSYEQDNSFGSGRYRGKAASYFRSHKMSRGLALSIVEW
jgi:hypothetical protein